jgi:PPIC-type PPIASE domain
LKIHARASFTFLAIVTMIAAQACSLLNKREYASISATDLTNLMEGLPDLEKRILAQNEAQRKQKIEDAKKAYSLAQAAEAEGLQKTDRFQREMVLIVDGILAEEHKKRNPDVKIPQEEMDAYLASHNEEFEADFRMLIEDRKPAPTDEQKEILKSQLRNLWSNIKIESQKAREAGFEKQSTVASQIKFEKARLLANHYSRSIRDQIKLTPEEKSKYIAEHPEADLEKVKQKAEGILGRVKKGESFEKIADEVNKDRPQGRSEDLGWFSRGRMVPEFENAAFALKKGETSGELVKTKFGYHIIRVDDKRTAKRPATPPNLMAPAPGGDSNPEGGQNNQPVEEIRARHILISTQQADEVEQRLIAEKVKKVLDEAEGKYPVDAPADFVINVPAQDPQGAPAPGGGQGK